MLSKRESEKKEIEVLPKAPSKCINIKSFKFSLPDVSLNEETPLI